MYALIEFSKIIDKLNLWIGRAASWLVLIMVLISTVNALSRKLFALSSNAFLEIQWYLFAALFLLSAAYTLQKQEHVRIDLLLNRFSVRNRLRIELAGFIVFFFPFVLTMIALSVPFAWHAFQSGEMSSNAGGLIRWPVYALIPIGFILLALQGISEVIKRLATEDNTIAVEDVLPQAVVSAPDHQPSLPFDYEAEPVVKRPKPLRKDAGHLPD